ncbi:MAG: hypothetical protein KDB29_11325 [Planctomycetes bacterium]|nr:hypothetical protein [Planctomycetota bacterium]
MVKYLTVEEVMIIAENFGGEHLHLRCRTPNLCKALFMRGGRDIHDPTIPPLSLEILQRGRVEELGELVARAAEVVD